MQIKQIRYFQNYLKTIESLFIFMDSPKTHLENQIILVPSLLLHYSVIECKLVLIRYKR